METQNDKIEALLGFAIKAGKLLYGVDNIATYRKKIHLLVADKSLGRTAEGVLRSVSSNRKIPILICNKPLSDILHKMNCKAVGLRDAQMAKAIKENINGNYQLILNIEPKN